MAANPWSQPPVGSGVDPAVYEEEMQLTMERESDRSISSIRDKVQRMRKIGDAIHIEVQRSNEIMDQLNHDMGGAGFSLENTMAKLKNLQHTASSRHMCYLILFVVFLFLVLYYVFGR